MKKIVFMLFLVTAFLGFAEQTKETVAVPMFAGSDTETSKVLADLFGTKLVARNLFRVLTRTNIEALTKETDYQMSGNTSDEEAVSIGKQLNAKYVVAGNLTTLGTLKVLYVQLINVETGEIISGSEKKFTRIEDAYDYVDDLVGIMVSKLTGEKYVTTDDIKFDKDKYLAQYRFSRNMMIGSRVTWITALVVTGVSGMILTDRGTRPASEYLKDPLFAVPAAGTIIMAGAIVSDVVFTLRTNSLKKELDRRGIKYAFLPGFQLVAGNEVFSPSMVVSLSG
jgi:TolB-like protein